MCVVNIINDYTPLQLYKRNNIRYEIYDYKIIIIIIICVQNNDELEIILNYQHRLSNRRDKKKKKNEPAYRCIHNF